MDIQPLSAQHLPWVLTKSVATGWEQLTPRQQELADPVALATQVQQMVLTTLNQPGGAGFVAVEAGVPAGYILVGIGPSPLTGTLVGMFNDIYVEPSHRRRGTGRLLCRVGEEYLRRLGIAEVKRVIAAHNEASLRHALSEGNQVERFLLTKSL